MPRDKGGIGRTGKKHKKSSKFDVHRRDNSELAGKVECEATDAAVTNDCAPAPARYLAAAPIPDPTPPAELPRLAEHVSAPLPAELPI